MATMLYAGAGARGLSTMTTRAILNSVATRLDEGRELNRYLVGLLVFLGLLGTFWGLLETVHSISGVIESMKAGKDTATMFDDLKTGLSAPIAGMSVSFTSSLFGLASSLILGFLDLQAGQAQNRFYSEFEEFLASHVETTPAVEARPEPTVVVQPRIEHQRNAAAIATLAEGIQALVGHMRTEQQQIRDWVDVQAAPAGGHRQALAPPARGVGDAVESPFSPQSGEKVVEHRLDEGLCGERLGRGARRGANALITAPNASAS